MSFPCRLHFSILAILLGTMILTRFSPVLDQDLARDFIVRFGYAVVIVLLVVFAFTLVDAVKRCWPPRETVPLLLTWVRSHRLAIIAILILTIMVHAHEPHRLRTMNDEFALLSTSHMAHTHKTVAIPSRMVYFENQPLYVGNHPDIRLPLFPVVVSLLHDFIGYRPANQFVVNILITPFFFLLIYVLSVYAGGSRQYGILGLLLAFSIPLLAQVATSGGYDLLNVCILCGLAIIGRSYVLNPSAQNQTLLIYTGILAAYCRYESVLYLFVVAFLVARHWLQSRSVRLRLIDALSPLFLILPIAYNIYYTGLELFQEPVIGEQTYSFFSTRYFQENLGEALVYFFSSPTTSSTSILVALPGFLSVVYLIAHVLISPGKAGKSPFTIAFAPMIVIVMGFLGMILCNYWGQLTDYQAVRFALPVLTLMVPPVIWFIVHNKLSSPQLMSIWLGLALTYIFLFTIPAQAQHQTTQSMIPSFFREFTLNYARETGGPRTFFLSKGALGLIAHGIPAAPIDYATAHPDRVIEGFQFGHYDMILSDRIVTFDRDLRAFQTNVSLGALSSEGFEVEPVYTLRFGPVMLFQITRVVAARNSEGTWVDLTTRATPDFQTPRDQPLLMELLRKVP